MALCQICENRIIIDDYYSCEDCSSEHWEKLAVEHTGDVLADTITDAEIMLVEMPEEHSESMEKFITNLNKVMFGWCSNET